MATQHKNGASRLLQAQERAARRSGVRAAAFLGLAIIAAIVAALIVTQKLDERLDVIESTKVPTAPVVVAATDMPLGTSIEADMLQTIAWPKSSVPEGTFTAAEELIDRVVAAKIFKGEPVLQAKLADTEAGAGLAAILPPGLLAVAVRVDEVVGVAGFIHPGDRVDVIVTMKPDQRADSMPTSKIILQNIQVLAVGQQTDRQTKKANKPIRTTVATLLVSPEQAERVALSAARGEILLALRSSLFEDTVETEGMVPTVMLPQKYFRKPSSGRARAKPAEPPPVVKPEEPKEDVVEILRGDLYEKRRFQERRQGE